MRILIHDYAGHPFQIQLSRELASRGHEVRHLYAGYNQTPRGALAIKDGDPQTFDVCGVFIRQPLNKDNFIKRWLQEREYGRAMAREVAAYQPDVIISANTPLDAQKAIFSAAQAHHAKTIFWLQDFIGIAAYSLLNKRIGIFGKWVGRYYIALERRLLRSADAVVAISEDFLPTLEAWGISDHKLHVVPNWAPLSEIRVVERATPWAREYGLLDGFNFVYTGTLRMKHNPALLLELARELSRFDTQARMIVTSEGPGADWLKERSAALDLHNVVVLPFQPMERYAEVLGSADVLVAILEKEAGAFSVPSKVLSYLCAKRPLLLAVPKQNLAAKIVSSQRAGIVVEPDNVSAFVEGAKSLLSSPALREKMAENARSYAEANFDIQAIGDQFEAMIR